MELIDNGGAGLDQIRALPGEITEIALRKWWDKTPAQQPVAEQLRNPLGVVDIGFAARYIFDVLGIDDQHRKGRFKERIGPKRYQGTISGNVYASIKKCKNLSQCA